MSKRQVMLVTGGVSGERGISLISASNIWRGLQQLDFDCTLAWISPERNWFLVEDPALFFEDPEHYLFGASQKMIWEFGQPSCAHSAGRVIKPDVVFPMVHGTLGEDGALQGFLTMANLPYVGCDVLGAAVNMDKTVAKRLWQQAGLPVVPWLEVSVGESIPSWQTCVSLFGEDLFVKAVNQGSSLGVYQVRSGAELEEAISMALQYSDRVLIEQGVVGREIEVAVLLDDHPMVSVPGEISVRSGFYDYEAKYNDPNAATIHVPADLTREQIQAAKNLAMQAARASYCCTYARVDLFLAQEKWWINEINTVPGFTAISLYPQLIAHEGLGLSSLLRRMLDHALIQHAERVK